MELSSVATRRIEEERDSAKEGVGCMLVSRQKDSIRRSNGICIGKVNSAHSLMNSFARSSIDEACVWRTKA